MRWAPIGPALAGDQQPGANRGTGEDQRRDPAARLVIQKMCGPAEAAPTAIMTPT
jgi:hypothetical protein